MTRELQPHGFCPFARTVQPVSLPLTALLALALALPLTLAGSLMVTLTRALALALKVLSLTECGVV